MDCFAKALTASAVVRAPDLIAAPRRILGVREDIFPAWPGWQTVRELGKEASASSGAYLALLRQDVLLESQAKDLFFKSIWAPLELGRLPTDLAAVLLGMAADFGPEAVPRGVRRVLFESGLAPLPAPGCEISVLADLNGVLKRAARQALLLQRIFRYPWHPEESAAEPLSRFNLLDYECCVLDLEQDPAQMDSAKPYFTAGEAGCRPLACGDSEKDNAHTIC